MRRSLFAGFALFAALALAACGGGASPAPASQPPASQPDASEPAASEPADSGTAGGSCELSTETATVESTIEGFAFEQSLTATVGDVVSWTNNDSAPHTVTMDDGSCEAEQFASGESAALKFNAAGTYAFHCEVHPDMKGTIEVGE
jgi:plastocyanin